MRSDDHQRAVLSVKVRLPVSHVHVTCADGQSDCSAGAVGTKETTIDVMTSHFRYERYRGDHAPVCRGIEVTGYR